MAREGEERGNQVYAHRLLGLIAGDREKPDIEIATKHYREAMELADRLFMKPLLARCHLGLGQMLRRSGQEKSAAPHLLAAGRFFKSMNMALWLEGLSSDFGNAPADAA
ncbi:MAG TPA: hypothetical protein VLS90_17670 [Thermodesulfobacteriota bacterium]|nr:hypothetical protein [Thermodesulfobacteriota bacterium]